MKNTQNLAQNYTERLYYMETIIFEKREIMLINKIFFPECLFSIILNCTLLFTFRLENLKYFFKEKIRISFS